MAMDIESSVDPPTSSELVVSGDRIIQMTQFIEDVKKLGSLAIMLEIKDWESIVSSNELHPARIELMRKFIDRGKGMKELYIILMEPAVDARRSAEKIGQILPVECRVAATSCLLSSSTEGIPRQYRMSYIENIVTQYKTCTRPNVLNCLSYYPADWASIGSYLVGQGFVDQLNQYCRLPGDEVAYLVERWWSETTDNEFSWERLRAAIVHAAEKKYGHLEHYPESMIAGDDLNEKVETDMNILLCQFDDLQFDVWNELSDLNFRAFKRKLTVCCQLEPHDARYLEKLLDKPSVKSIDNFFQNANECWNFLDVGILKILIMKFIKSDEIKSRMKDYNSRLIKFQQTPVALVIKALQKRNIHPRKPEDCHGYQPIIQNLELNPYCCTLAHLNYLRTKHYDKLRELGLLQTALMVLNNAELCCVIVAWLVMEDEVFLFEEMFNICIKEGVFLEDNNISSIQLNGKVLQSMERALLEASTRDDVKRIDHLLQSWNRHKHNINKTNKEGKTSLIVASELGHSGVVALLVEEDAVNIDYQMQDTLWTALFFAYHGGHQNTVKILEEYGASKAIKDKNGRCAQELSQVLLKPEKPRKSFRERLSSGFKDIFSFRKKKIFKYCEIGEYEEVKKMILSKEVEVDVKDGKPKNWTPLMHACKNGHYEIVKFLLDNGADIHVKSTMNDWTPLAVAASWDKLRIANLLLKNRANPNDIIDPDESHYSILMYISDMGYVEMARALLKYGADLEIPNNLDNATPLFGAIDSEDERMVKLFLEYGADFNRQAKTNWTPLMESARRSSSKICKMLIDCGAKTELVMQGAGKVSGEAAIHVACYFGQAEVARLLIESGTDVNRENEMGLTPLMIATKRGHMDVTETLVKCESLDINQLHKENGFSALFWAATTGNIEVCEKLLQYKALSDLGGINIVDCAPILQKKAMKQLFIKYKSVNLPVQREVVVPSQMTEDVVHEELPEETHLPLQMKSHEESQTKVVKTSENQEEREDVMEQDETVFDSKISQITQPESATESSKVIQEIQAEVTEPADDRTTSTDERLSLPKVEAETSVEQVAIVGDRDTSDVCAEHEEIAGEEEEKIPEKVIDDDSSLYGDEEVSQPSKSETISQATRTLQEKREQVLQKFRNMTLEERKALIEQIWTNYTTSINSRKTSGSESTKGVQQVDIRQQQIITST